MAPYLYAPLYLCAQLYELGIPSFVFTKLEERLSKRKLQHIRNKHLATILNGGFEGSKSFFDRLAWAEGFLAKQKLIRSGLFHDRKEMAQRFNVPENSPKIYGLYLLRLIKIITTQKPTPPRCQ
jgi:hypothetical protein